MCWFPLGALAALGVRSSFSPSHSVWRFAQLLFSILSVIAALADSSTRLDPRIDFVALSAFSLGVAVASALAARPRRADHAIERSPSVIEKVFALSALVCAIDATFQHAFRFSLRDLDDRFRGTQGWLELLWLEVFLASLVVQLDRIRALIGIALLVLPHFLRSASGDYWQLWKWMFALAAVLPFLPTRRQSTANCARTNLGPA
jgi:hypothetical protein